MMRRMAEPTAADPQPHADRRPEARPVLLVAEGEPAGDLQRQLEEAGFLVSRVTPGEAARAADDATTPVLIAFGGRGDDGRLVSLARSLRARPETFARPVVFLFREDSRTLRSAAEHFGADDYFSQRSTAVELRARLEALLWRAAAGRRAAPAVAEQRSEIDNFIFLLDAVGADAQAGGRGTVALVEAAGAGGGEGVAERTLLAAHGFLKLNLRRADAVAFYGPTTLVVYLPRVVGAAARQLLAGLREEFREGRPRADLRAGLVSFPSDGVEVERLVEQAESALSEARAANPPAGVFVYGEAAQAGVAPATKTEAVVVEAPTPAPETTPAAPSDFAARRAKARRMMLIVSDAELMARVNLLMRSAGYEVRAAFDAQHALGLLRIDRPDLLLVDYDLGGMDGVEMLRRLRKQSGQRRPPPAVLLLPGGREDLRAEASEAGARAAVSLPYDPVELLELLERIGDPDE